MLKQNKKNYTMILLAIISAVFVVCIDVGIVSPARTTIAHSLKATDAQSIWIMTSYSLAFAASMIIWGIISDKFGKKITLLITLTMFVVMSVVCGLSNQFHSFTLMIVARSIQGFFAGGIIPAATTYIATEFPLEKRGLAMGLIGTSFSIGNIIGPTAGSALLDWLGSNNWGWLFYINIFFGIIAVPMIMKFLTETPKQKDLKIEIFSILFSSAAVVSVMLFFTNADFSENITKVLSHTNVWVPVVSFVVCSILTVVFTAWLKGPLYVIKDLFKNKAFVLSVIASCIVALSLFAVSMYLPQISETFFKLNEGKGGYFSTIIGVGGLMFGPIAGALVSKLGPKRILQLFSLGLLGGFVIFYFTLLNDWYVMYYISLFVIGASQSAIIGLVFNYFLQLEVGAKLQASAQSMLSLFRSVFGSIAPTIAVLLLKPSIKKVGDFSTTKGKHIKEIIKKQYETFISGHMKPIVSQAKAAAETKVKNLMISGQATPQKIQSIQLDTKNEIARQLVNVTKQAKTQIKIPKFSNNTCNNLHSISKPLKDSFVDLCSHTRHIMLDGFSNVTLYAICGVIIILVISLFFKNYDMKSLIKNKSSEKTDEEKLKN